MKKFVVIAILSCLTFTSYAQRNSHKIYLNNGSIVVGKMVKTDSLTTGIQTDNGSVWVFKNTEIEKIEKVVTIRQYLATGYHNYTAFGILPSSSGNKNSAPFLVSMEHHYQFNTNYSVGLKTGIELLNETVAPLALDIKYILPFKSMGLFASAYTGYAISLEKPEEEIPIKRAYGGFLMGTDLGLVFPISHGNCLYVALGYRYNELKYKREDWYYGDIDRIIYFNRLQLKMGIILY